MRKLFLIEDSIVNKISYYLLVSFLVFLPFEMLYSQLALIGFGLHTLINFTPERLSLLFNRHVLAMISLYLFGLAGILYSPDIKEALNVSGRQLAILIFPVLLVLNGLDLNKYKPVLLEIFGLTCVVVILFLYTTAIYNIQYGQLPFSSLFSPDFMNHNFSLPIQLHATYLSMYATLAVTVFLYLFRNNNRTTLRIFYCSCIIILLCGIIQLSSRAALISLLLIINIVLPLFLFNKKKTISVLILTTVLSVGALFSIYSIDSFKSRYVRELKNELGMDTLNPEFTEPRLERWEAQMELIRESPVFGYGSGSEKELLKKKFFEKKFYIPYARNFNSHSQYLSFLLNMGMLGLAGYLYILCYGFWFAWKRKEIIFMGFMIIITIVSFSENILFLNKGIFFYSFFLSLFLLTGNNRNNETA